MGKGLYSLKCFDLDLLQILCEDPSIAPRDLCGYGVPYSYKELGALPVVVSEEKLPTWALHRLWGERICSYYSSGIDSLVDKFFGHDSSRYDVEALEKVVNIVTSEMVIGVSVT